jgi:hypothetical protein
MKLAELWDHLVDAMIRALITVVPSRYRVVPRAEAPETPLLEQFALIRGASWIGRRFGALYFQHFCNPEPSGFAHRHRWARMRSLVLSGGFVEERFAIGVDGVRRAELWPHWRGSSYSMGASDIHRVAWWGPRCWTLFHMSVTQTDSWGWYAIEPASFASTRRQLGAFTPWREHIVRRIESLDTPGKVTQ